jgi:hypothetical protein
MDRTIPTEFADFIRTVAIRALDRLTDRARELDTAPRAVVRAWAKLRTTEKNRLIDDLIADTREGGGPKPRPATKRRAKKKE